MDVELKQQTRWEGCQWWWLAEYRVKHCAIAVHAMLGFRYYVCWDDWWIWYTCVMQTYTKHTSVPLQFMLAHPTERHERQRSHTRHTVYIKKSVIQSLKLWYEGEVNERLLYKGEMHRVQPPHTIKLWGKDSPKALQSNGSSGVVGIHTHQL